MVSTRSRTNGTNAPTEEKPKPEKTLTKVTKKKASKPVEERKTEKEPAKGIQEGDACPDFMLALDNGETVSLEDMKESTFVLYFYPKDNTPGCTKEAKAFNDLLPEFEKKSVKVFGVSGDSAASHTKFIEKLKLKFNLIVDEKLGLAKQLGCATQGNKRKTYLVKNGTIVKFWPKVSVATHAQTVLDAIEN